MDTIKANEKRCLEEAEVVLASAAVVFAICGYQKVTEVAQYAAKEGLSLKEAAVRSGVMSEEDAEKLLDPLMLTDTDARKSGRLFLDINARKAE